MKIALAADHGGFALKNLIIEHLVSRGFEVKDFGTHNAESTDYPSYAKLVAAEVTAGDFDFGILVCGTGTGMAITANKIKGVRAALCTCEFMARMGRAHNDANILALGERVVGPGLALDIVDAFLATPFEGGRHQRRLDQIPNN